MQVDVALDVLGLSGEPTATEVRRAYLRQVKLWGHVLALSQQGTRH